MTADSPATATESETLTPEQIRQRSIVQLLRTYEPVVDKLLVGTGQTRETFMAQIANAMRTNPKLWGCEPATVLGAALRCAQLGMPPNDGTNRTWIIPRPNRKEGTQEAIFQIGYGGVLELARRAVPGAIFEGRPVYPNDTFEVDYGSDHFKHEPWFSTGHADEGGDAYLWYVLAKYPDGGRHLHVLSKNQVEYHRSFSKRPDDDMWKNSYDAAALKSVVTDMRRWLPASVKLALAIQADGDVVDVRQMSTEEPVAAIEAGGDSRLSADADKQPPADLADDDGCPND